MPSFAYENNTSKPVIGIDEAGCGPWAGPVVAGAVHFNLPFDAPWLLDINDSKKLSPKKRKQLYTHITESSNHITFGIGFCSAEEIDTFGLSQGITIAVERALTPFNDLKSFHLLVDGIRKPELNYDIKMLVKGDQKSLSIAAASILAKVARDNYMQKLHSVYPMYGWLSNAGYGTKQHIDGITNHGICKEHRKSYKPIQHFLGASC